MKNIKSKSLPKKNYLTNLNNLNIGFYWVDIHIFTKILIINFNVHNNNYYH